MKKVAVAVLAIMLIAAGLVFYLQRQWNVSTGSSEAVLIDIPRGLGARGVMQLLVDRKVIANRDAALAYVLYSGNRNRLRAGEYMFDHPMTIREVIGKLSTGAVYLHKFTVPEGLTTEATAMKWQEQGFGTAEEFLKAAEDAVERVRRLDDKATTVEGYLFPETYSFPKQTSARRAVDAMIGRFEEMVERMRQVLPVEQWPLNLHDTVILASLVESEAAQADERTLVASVYWNRLKRHILLQCDPTVIYALMQEKRYNGKLTLADLQFKSPYNTYMNPGLPPGPISNPGYASLSAAIQPAVTDYLFFVRTIESRHTFSETLAAHNRAVAAYRKMRKPS